MVLAAIALSAPPAPPPSPIGPAAKPPDAEPRTKLQIQAAREFAFEGVGLDTKLDAFLEKYPAAELQEAESDLKLGLKTYRVKELQTADEAEYSFLDQTLFRVTAFYHPERLKEMGGDTIPLRKLVQKLGKPDKNSPGIQRHAGEESYIAKWDFSDPRRRITFVATAKTTFVSFADTPTASLVKKRATDNAELGF